MEKQIQFKIGDILNFSWNGWYGRIIKFHNYAMYGYNPENRWTHTAIIGDIKGNDVIVYEALKDGFVTNIYSIELLNSWIKSGNMIVGRSKHKLTYVKKNCDKYLGTPYGKFDIISIGFYTIFRGFFPTIPTKTKQIICSEATARILYDSSKKKLNFEKEFDKRYDLLTPIDLYYSKQIKWFK